MWLQRVGHDWSDLARAHSTEPPSFISTSQTFHRIKTLELWTVRGWQDLGSRDKAAGAGGGLCPRWHPSKPRAGRALSYWSPLIGGWAEAPDMQDFSRKPARHPTSQDGGECKENCRRRGGEVGSWCSRRISLFCKMKEVLEWARGGGCIAAWMCITTLDSVTSKWLSGELYLCVLGWPKSCLGFFLPPPHTITAYRKPHMNLLVNPVFCHN